MSSETLTNIPTFYVLFLLYIEPVSALLGAYFAYFQPPTYLSLTHSPSANAATPIPIATEVALAQVANLYLLFALNEGLVLRATRSRRVWRTLLFVLLVADIGHLVSVVPLATATPSVVSHGMYTKEQSGQGLWDVVTAWTHWSMRPGSASGWGGVYWKVSGWNAMAWGNVGFVYFGACTRVCFLCGIGLGDQRDVEGRNRRSGADSRRKEK
jgi:hypothetical protein